MVVSFVLDTEYMGVAERNKWFLKVVSNAVKEDTLIVTHSYFKDHITDVLASCNERFYDGFEMEHISEEQIRNLDICYIPDEWFDAHYYECGSRSKQIIDLYNNNNIKFERFIESSIDEALMKRNENKPLFLFSCLHVFEFVRAISVHYGCPIIPWVFSAVRKVHGYSQTLYMAHIDNNLFNSKACSDLLIQNELEKEEIPVFSKQEILALLGKEHNMVLLPLINRKGLYDIGVVGEGFHITPEIYQEDSVTDDDIYYECKRHFDVGSIVTRQHPLQLDQSGIGRKHMKNDPAAFVLSCRRVATVQSQMIIKAAMWNRSPIVFSNALPYSCLLNRAVKDSFPIKDWDLNFILFVYFVPDSCMFSTDYWQWRMTNPSISSIAKKHLKSIFHNLSIPDNLIDNNDDRLKKLLVYRGVSGDQLHRILYPVSIDDVPYYYPSSYIHCMTNDDKDFNVYCLNHESNGDTIVSEFTLLANCSQCDFVPQNDLDGYITIDMIRVNDQEVTANMAENYYNKNQTVVTIPLESDRNNHIVAKWRVRRFV